MNSYIDYTQLQIDEKSRQDLLFLYEKYMNHEFDLLGSGWIRVEYGMQTKGFRGNRYLCDRNNLLGKYAKRKLSKRVSADYSPINWFVDYKSGFLFAPCIYNTPLKCLAVMEKEMGVEIKCPWELGRFYHMVQLAILAVFDMDKRIGIIKEFSDEALDFIYMNPVGKTVQWSAVMDASIRNVNLLVAYDILKQLDSENILDEQFGSRFTDLIYEGTQYIIHNLEYCDKGVPNSNHYLSNLVGVAFAAAYLDSSSETDAWIVFAVQEMIDQVQKQFYEDGSNFEGSTSYHRLSSEFVLYTTALVFGVLETERKNAFITYDKDCLIRLKNIKLQKYDLSSENFFPEWYLERLYNAGIFTQTIIKHNDEIVQIGDNDSGRLIKLSPLLVFRDEFEENLLNHSSILSAISGLYNTDRFDKSVHVCPLEYSFIRVLSKKKIAEPENGGRQVIPYSEQCDIKELAKKYAFSHKKTLYRDDNGTLLNEQGNVYYYDKFGVLVYRNRRVFLSVCIPPTKKPVLTGHRHNDALSVEIMVDGQYITRDPGNYIYTSAPELRNKFRSVYAHNTIHVNNVEQNHFQGTFGMKYVTGGELISCDERAIIVKANYKNIEHVRVIQIDTDAIAIEDYCDQPFSVSFKNRIFSTGYGKVIRGK